MRNGRLLAMTVTGMSWMLLWGLDSKLAQAESGIQPVKYTDVAVMVPLRVLLHMLGSVVRVVTSTVDAVEEERL
jgi:hypothetical protein